MSHIKRFGSDFAAQINANYSTMQRTMLIISKEVKEAIRSQLLIGDQAEISKRLAEKGYNVSPAYLNQFLTHVRPARKIGHEIVKEAQALLAERSAGNKEMLRAIQSLAA